ncbi:MAG: DNA gyrase inhibitor YacG [Myxococcales bacterium]
MAQCPICKKTIAGPKTNDAFPFCSPRCRLLDLGKWLGGDYRIAGRPEENEDEMPLPDPAAPPGTKDKDDDGDAS